MRRKIRTDSSFQARVQSRERDLESYREQHFRGSARVRLNCLAFDNDFDGQIHDGRNVTRLEHILEIQGCLRINREYHARSGGCSRLGQPH